MRVSLATLVGTAAAPDSQTQSLRRPALAFPLLRFQALARMPIRGKESATMRVFKPTATSGGSRRVSPRWHVEFRDHNETRRRVTAFPDKAASVELGRKLEKLIACRVVGERPGAELGRFIDGLSPSIREKLAAWGVLDSRTLSTGRPQRSYVNNRPVQATAAACEQRRRVGADLAG